MLIRRGSAKILTVVALVLAASCTSGPPSYCGLAADLTNEETRFTTATFAGGKAVTPDVAKHFVESAVTLFGKMLAIAPEEVRKDVATLAGAAARTRDRLKALGYDMSKLQEDTDAVVDEARSRFDAFNKGNCKGLPRGVEASLVPR